MSNDFVTLGLSLTILIGCGRYIIVYLSRAARHFGLSEFTIAFIILAVATSFPELFIAISSATQNAGDIVLAVAFGSNVINTSLVIGLAAFLSVGISTAGLNLRRDIIIGAAITIMPIFFLLDGSIYFLERFVLLCAFFFYLFLLYRDHHKQPSKFKFPHLLHGLIDSLIALIFIVILIIAADYVVSSSASLAQSFRVPSFLIGLFVLAFGTSLPELVLAIQASLSHKPGLALGNVIGTNIANSGLVIGLASIAAPLKISLTPSILATTLFLLVAIVTLGIFATSKQKISTKEGLALIALFLIFIPISLFASAII